MIRFNKFDAFQFDRKCIFAFVNGNNVAAIDYANIFPRNDLQGNIFEIDGSLIKTSFNLKSLEDAAFLFLADLQLDIDKLPLVNLPMSKVSTPEFLREAPKFATISLLKQGTTNLNGLLDISLECCQCTDGVHRRLIVKQYFECTSRINIEKTTYNFSGDEFIGKSDLLLIRSSTSTGLLSIWLKDKLLFEEAMNADTIMTHRFNKPRRDTVECSCVDVGDKNEALLLKSAAFINKNVSSSLLDPFIRAIA